MSKQHSKCAEYLVYLIVRILVCVIQTLSLRQAYALAGGLAWVIYHVDRRHRLVASDNLRLAFPERFSDSEANDTLVRAVYRHFCLLLVELMLVPRKLHPSNWRKYLELPEGRIQVERLLSRRPVLVVTGHFGNWEMGGYVQAMFGFRTHAIARPLDNPYLDDFLRRFRERTGQKILAKKGDFDQMQGVLAGGGMIGTLADQDAGPRGQFVNFFGRPASTHKAIALLALEHRVPLLVFGARRVGEPMRYRTIIEDVIFPEEYDGDPDAVRAITQRFTSGLERIIRQAPEQYLWLHRRWKHQPAPRKRKAAERSRAARLGMDSQPVLAVK
jgi:KDO2-lipid IV(A) lauroyltransferase